MGSKLFECIFVRTISLMHGTQLTEQVREVLPQSDVDWSGASLRDAREALGLTLRALSEYTRIRRGLLDAIENEHFAALPAAAFTRGLLLQLVRRLGLRNEQLVADSYMRRYDAGK